MNILVLNGSPRQNGNTAKMVTAFCEGAESSNHTVKTVTVCKLNVKGCLACEYCHNRGKGKPELFMHIGNCICKWLCMIKQLQS